MLVVTRFRSPDLSPSAQADLRVGLERSRDILASCVGNLAAEVGRNVDDPTLWVLSTRWANVGSYRRAIGPYAAKLHRQALLVPALDEPSAYEVVEEGTEMNEAAPRSLG